MRGVIGADYARYVKYKGFFVFDRLSHPALREWRRHFSEARTWIVIAGIAAALSLAAPFESDRLMRALPRFCYWFGIVASTYMTGFLVAHLMLGLQARLGRPLLVAASAIVGGIAITAVVAIINLLALDYWPGAEAPVTFGTTFCIAAIVSLLFEMVSTHPTAETVAPAPSILDRIPLEKRGPLVAISVEDHYVRVRTHKGEAVILMRLGDAMRETGQTQGLQVHRSHWVSVPEVRAARRDGDRAILTMSHGTEIPVSRRYIPDIKEAGLLPG